MKCDIFCRAPKKARKWTQILAVVAVSFGAFIHGTTVSFPAVAIPSLCWNGSSNQCKNESEIETGDTNDELAASENVTGDDTFMPPFRDPPFEVVQDDIALIGT